MKSAVLRDIVCGLYCAYYKPEGKEDLSCRGYALLDHLTGKGLELPADHPSSHRDAFAKMQAATRDMLRQRLCTACPFCESDCDHAEGVEDALPCGGFILIGRLIDSGAVSVDDVHDIG